MIIPVPSGVADPKSAAAVAVKLKCEAGVTTSDIARLVVALICVRCQLTLGDGVASAV